MTKQPRLQLPKYLDAVRNHVTHCVKCGTTEKLDVAHYSGLYADRLSKGTGSKCHDYAVARLCRSCHTAMDSYAEGNNEERALAFLYAIEETLHCLHWSLTESIPVPNDLKQQEWLETVLKRMITSRLWNETANEVTKMLAEQRDYIAECGK